MSTGFVFFPFCRKAACTYYHDPPSQGFLCTHLAGQIKHKTMCHDCMVFETMVCFSGNLVPVVFKFYHLVWDLSGFILIQIQVSSELFSSGKPNLKQMKS